MATAALGDAQGSGSDVVIQLELVRRRAQADLVDLRALQLDPGLDQIGGEDVAAEQELVVGLEGVEDAAEAVRHGRDVRVLLGRELVEVLVDRGQRLGLVEDVVKRSASA